MTRFEPPYTEPYVRWCGRNGSARTRSYPIKDLANSSLLISVCLKAMLELDETDADDGNGDNPEGDLSP